METLNSTMSVIFAIQAGWFVLWLIRTRIPKFLCMISSFFLGAACGWNRLWEVYREALQRTSHVHAVPVAPTVTMDTQEAHAK